MITKPPFFRRWITTALITMSVVSVVQSVRESRAMAQPSPTPSAADRETARSLMGEGDTKFDAKDFAGALTAYEGANRIMGVPTTGIAVARALEALGQVIEARDVALQIARSPAGANDPKAFVQARADAEALADRLASRIATVKIEVTGAPAGTVVQINIDGAALPADVAGLPRKVNPGKRVITASAQGFTPVVQELNLKPGEKLDVKLVLTEAKKGDGAANGKPTAATPLAEDAAKKDPKGDHRAFYARVALGLGGMQSSEKVTAPALPTLNETYSKAALRFDLAFGYHVGHGFAVGGELMYGGMSNPSIKQAGVSAKGSGTVNTFILGPFFDWFATPRGGWHAGALLGLAGVSHSVAIRGAKSLGGLGIGGEGGYDVYFADGWAVGPVVDLGLVLASAKTTDSSAEKRSATALSVTLGARLLYF